MPVGLMNAPSSFHRMMNELVRHLDFIKVYLNDVVIFSRNLPDHLRHLQAVVNLISEHGLKVKLSKCEFGKRSVALLGHIVDQRGVHVGPSKVEVILETPRPKTRTELRSSLGIAGYCRRFICSFASISAPLHAMTSVKAKFSWSAEMETALDTLKKAMTSPPVLTFLDFEQAFLVETDASSVAIGAVLAQRKEDGRVHPVQFASRTMSTSDRKYFPGMREALAVIFALRKFRLYLLSSKRFVVYSDQQALKDAFARKDIHGRLASWLDFIAEYDFELRYRKGSSNKAADFLSRSSCFTQPPVDEDEGDVVNVAVIENSARAMAEDMEPFLQDVAMHLEGDPLNEKTGVERASIRKRSVQLVVWEQRLYHRLRHKLVVVASRQELKRIMASLHDDLGHWDAAATRSMIAERFWWPDMMKDIAHYVKTCGNFQKMGSTRLYTTSRFVPQSSLLDVFSIDFASPFPETTAGNKFLLVSVEHLTGWPIVSPTKLATAQTVLNFIKQKIIPPFGAPKVVITDNGACFTAQVLQSFMRQCGTSWRTVLAYAPMSNGRAERMIRTLKHGIRRVLANGSIDRDEAVHKVVFGYCRRPLREAPSPFQLLYGVKPRILSTDVSRRFHAARGSGLTFWEVEILVGCSERASRASTQNQAKSPKRVHVERFKVGDLVLVAHGLVFSSTKWPAVRPKLYGPCTVERAQHPRYYLRSSTGRRTRDMLYARRLVSYHPRL